MTIDEIKLVQPKPGDTVILKLQEKLTKEQTSQVVKRFSRFFPGCQILVFHSGADIEVQPCALP